MKLAVSPLDERAAQWRRLPRCTAEEQAAAEAFYESQVLPLFLAQAVEREHAHLARRYAGLILAVGADPTPALFSLAVVRPERVHFIYSQEHGPAFERLAALVQEPALRPAAVALEHEAEVERVRPGPGPRPTPFERTRVDGEAIQQAYAAVQEVHSAWGAPQATAVDISGGPPAVSAGMAMAAYVIGADVACVEAEEYWPDVGRARPGSLHLDFLPQPNAASRDLAAH